MGKTILELFQNKPLTQGPFVGQTAEEGYAVRDFKKENPISSPYALINSTGFALANIARRNFSIKKKESWVEQERTGLRIIRLGAIPIIYGGKASKFITGADLLRITQERTNSVDTMKSAANGGSDIGLLGGTLNAVKSAASWSASKLGIEFPQKLIPSKLILNPAFRTDPITGEKLAFPLTPDKLAKIKKDAAGNIVGKFLAKNVAGTPNQIAIGIQRGAINEAKRFSKRLLFGSRKKDARNLAKNNGRYNSKARYSGALDATNTDIKDRFDLSSILDNLQNPPPPNPNFIGPPAPPPSITIIPTYPTKKTRNKYFYTNDNQNRYSVSGIGGFHDDKFTDIVITGNRGMNNGADTINAYGAEENDADNTIDFITLKFDNVQFKATITGLSETFSPSFDSNKFIGSPFNYYTYTGIERSVSFNFKVYSLNIIEHKNAWEKLQALAKKTYPIGYVAYGVVAPIIDFTMTDLYNRKKSFIESLSFTIDDNVPWEVFTQGVRAPHIIDVSITLKFIEQRGDEAKLYGFDSSRINTATRIEPKKPEQILNKPIVN